MSMTPLALETLYHLKFLPSNSETMTTEHLVGGLRKACKS